MAFTTDDFNKVWASTSPLTPYEFSESNYKEGWNFVGSTPPARQMWDSIQKQNDEKMKYIVDNFLPLSGGTITDDLEVNGALTQNSKSVEAVTSSGTNYIRYESGVQIVWGAINITPNASGSPFNYSGVGTVTFPVAFISNPYVVSNVMDNAGYWNSAISLSSTTGANITIGGFNQNQHGAQYIAIGKWK